MDDITSRVISILSSTHNVPSDSITLDTTLDELGIDSLDGVDLIFRVEQEFDLTIPDEAARGLSSVRQIVEALRASLAETT